MKKLLSGLLLMISFGAYSSESLIMRAANKEFAGCHVKLNVEGYKQMYINGEFKGNYVNRRDDAKLEEMIQKYIDIGKCREKRYTAEAEVVLRAANKEFVGCHVKLNVIGYNQIYVNNEWNFNFVNRNEDDLLENAVLSLISTGKCREREYQGGYALIDEMLAGEFANCSIKENVKGYIQLYIGNSLSGNYVIKLQEQALENRISRLIDEGACRYKY